MNAEQIKAKIAVYECGEKNIAEKKAKLQSELSALAKPELDYSKTIIATGQGEVYVLVAHCNAGSYTVQGYDWLRLSDGKFNSSHCWSTPQEAIACYNNARNIDFKDIFLAAMSEPLEEFTIDDKLSNVTTMRVETTKDGGTDIKISMKQVVDGTENQCWFYASLDEYAEFCKQANQVLATAKRKAGQ